jgi:hypothetical protein
MKPTLKSEYERGRMDGGLDTAFAIKAAVQNNTIEATANKAALIKEVAALAQANAKLAYAAALILTDKKPFGG